MNYWREEGRERDVSVILERATVEPQPEGDHKFVALIQCTV